MKITYLGQAGLMFEKEGFRVMVDPYLSNSIAKVNPKNDRRAPVDERFLAMRPDVLIFTHDHMDHYNPETEEKFLGTAGNITVLAPESAFHKALRFGGGHNYVQFNRHISWSQGGFVYTAVKAEHSDRAAVGALLRDGDVTYYVTGDTLYNEDIFRDVPKDVFALFLPINGVGNNMNMTDAARFARRINARKAVPLHVGMFDALSAKDFDCKNKVIPEIYKEIVL